MVTEGWGGGMVMVGLGSLIGQGELGIVAVG